MTFETLESGCLYYNGIHADPGEDGCVPLQDNLHELYLWLDYFDLRQCRHDFSIPAVQQVIKQRQAVVPSYYYLI